MLNFHVFGAWVGCSGHEGTDGRLLSPPHGLSGEVRCRDKKGCRKCILSACLEPDAAAALGPNVLILTTDAEAGTFLCLFYQIRKSRHKETRSGQSAYRMGLEISEEFVSAPVAVAEQCWEEVSC